MYLDLGTAGGFSENAFVGRKLRFGSKVVLLVVARVPRCQMITLDPDTAAPNPEVLRNVTRAHDRMAGVYAAVVAEGVIRVDDAVEVLD